MFEVKDYNKVIKSSKVGFLFKDGERIYNMLNSISRLSIDNTELNELTKDILKNTDVSIDTLVEFCAKAITLISPLSYRLFSKDDDFEYIIYDKFFSFAEVYPILESDCVSNEVGNLMCHIKQITREIGNLRNGDEKWDRMLSKDIANRIVNIFKENPIPEIEDNVDEEVEIIDIDSDIEGDEYKAYIVEAKSYPELEYIKLDPNFKTDLIDLNKYNKVKTSLKNVHMFKRKDKSEFACLSASGVLCFGKSFEKAIQKGLCW